MRANATPPSAAIAAAAVATNPAPYPKIRVGSELFDTLEPNEPSREHMEQERRMLEWKLRQRQSEEDSRWLAEEESQLEKKILFGSFPWDFSLAFFYEAEKEVVCCRQFVRPIRHGFDGRSECV
ncbi:hypothetical protein DAPPUDRAFT_234111 [Daphnia pulex]|uniref:Uncharacterized protein n=1 Tax=Daphnia pulex TaxID=6669 RepID=E9FUL4_DAPPU|nr:hypothetical protein DAPPUDRAFT_234111 [Daphnia pulex]|eukprot:EFX88906.1 hypothetical protein DAPPUDRAFT_234111 [Daphnia pulex]